MAVIESPTTPANLLEIDALGQAKVNTPTDPENAGFVRISDAAGTGIQTTENGALSVSEDCPILWEQVDGSALNTNVWLTSVSGMTVAQANGFITLNSGSATTANAYAILKSVKNIPMYAQLPIRASFNLRVPVLPQSNLTMEFGIGSVATNAAPTDGAFFRWNASTQFLAVINNNGTETTSAPITAPAINIVEIFEIVLVEDLVQFFVGDTLLATIQVPAGIAYPTNSGRLPLFARVYNGASTPGAAPQISIGQVFAAQQAMRQNKTWPETLAVLGRGAYQSPVTAFTQTAQHTNSTSPTSATLSNTTPSYTTLGGRWQFAALAGAATDYALFAYQVPAGYQLFIDSVSISSVVTGAVIAVTGTILDWSVGLNASAVSLATAESPPTTYAPRLIPLGVQGFALLAAQGSMVSAVTQRFNAPLVVDSGRFLHIVLQVPIGTATASQFFRGDVMISGYFE